MKYIIKNCMNCHPDYWINCTGNAENKGFRCLCLTPTNVYCKDISDCALKQIVDKCKQFDEPIYKSETKDFYLKNPLADEILKFLEIEEVNE